ncbi:MAG: sugar transferase, partial [Planctomycetota bacterium]
GELMRPLERPGDQLAAGESQAVAADRTVRTTLYARRGKRALDLLIVAAVAPLAILLSIPIALVNLTIFRRLDEVLFTQPRVGHRRLEFRIFKFRTMRAARNGSFDSWSGGGDTLRVTRFGKFLRNSHLDELPQLLNVVRGEMSLIGPRPEMVEIEEWAEREIPGFGVRLACKPGITGFAQVVQGYTGRDVEAYGEKLELSLDYLRGMSLRLDLWILWRTAVTMLKLDGWRWHDQLRGTAAERAARARTTPNPLWD